MSALIPSTLTDPSETIADVRRQVDLIQSLVKDVMKPGVHFDVIPGTRRKSLLQPGAQKLCLTFRLAPDQDKTVETILDLPNGHREYRVRLVLMSLHTGRVIAVGTGSCSTMEEKYRFRAENTGKEVPTDYWKTKNRDPLRAQELLGGPEFNAKKKDGRWMICHREEHDNPADYWNTCQKMAFKRAYVAAAIQATAAGDIFGEDDPGATSGATGQQSAGEGARPAARAAARGRQAGEEGTKTPIEVLRELVTETGLSEMEFFEQAQSPRLVPAGITTFEEVVLSSPAAIPGLIAKARQIRDQAKAQAA